MFLIGSRAANYWGLKSVRYRDNADWDIIGTTDELDLFVKNFDKVKVVASQFPGKFHIHSGDAKIEFDATGNGSNKVLGNMVNSHCYPNHFTIAGKEFLLHVPNREILYQIKRSHINFGVQFEKNMYDLRIMMIQWEMSGRDYNTEFFQLRKAEAKERFGAKQERIKLNKSNDEFFKGGSNLRTYVHDDLHKAVAYDPGHPTFLKCKRDVNSAKIDMDLFDELSHEDKLNMAMEESMVIALERFYIPIRGKRDYSEIDIQTFYRKGYLKEVKDLCKGKFQDFMIDNLLDLSKPKWNYVERFEKALEEGLINET